MVDHFHDQVIAKQKIGGEARAMVVCSSIDRAIQYFFAFRTYLKERKSPYHAIIAFSGEKELDLEGDGNKTKQSESSLNGFPSSLIPDKIQEDPYRFAETDPNKLHDLRRWTRFSMRVCPSTPTSWTKTARSTSRARPKPS